MDGVHHPWLIRLVEGIERHDETGRAETALGAMGIDYGLLHGMQPAILAGHPFHRHHRFAIQLRHQHQAPVGRFENGFAVLLRPNGDGAGAAIALGAALLGALETAHLAQVIKHCHGRRYGILLAQLAIENKTDWHNPYWPPARYCARAASTASPDVTATPCWRSTASSALRQVRMLCFRQL